MVLIKAKKSKSEENKQFSNTLFSLVCFSARTEYNLRAYYNHLYLHDKAAANL